MSKWRNNWKNIFCLSCVIMLVVSFSTGCSIGRSNRTSKIEKKADKINKIISRYYLNDIDEDNVEQNVYKGILNGLDDPYSVYYTPEEYQKLQEETSGNYVGIGVMVSQDPASGYLKVIKAFENGPAYEAGVRLDDYIIEVEGASVEGKDMSTVVTEIKGEAGTTVKITVLKADTKKTEELSITRRSIDVPTIEYQMLENDIGYIQVTEFDTVTADQYINALTDLEAQGQKALIVDLRDNPGGVLQTVVTMLQNMLPQGRIVYTEDKNGKGDTYSSDGSKEFMKPVVILVNGNSASASEVFTGAMKDYEKATIVGTTTFGKGIVQKIFPMTDGSALKLTISKYFTPNGTCIHGTGIEPDVEIEYDREAMGDTYDIKKDNQVNKALEILKEKIQ